jgi:NAD(P)H-nitrite reductase large subunit
MTQPGLIVIGSGPAGVSAAEAFRAHNGDVPVRILTADSDLPYERPPLSKDYLRGETEDVQLHPEQWYHDRSIELIRDLHVDRIDLQSRTVVAGEFSFDYVAVVLACGATPAALPVPGGRSPGPPMRWSSSVRASSAAKQRRRWRGEGYS